MLTDTDIVTAQGEGYVTLESIEELVALEADVDTDQGRFRVQALNFGQMIAMKEASEGDEWEATKRLLAAALVKPEVEYDDADVLGKLDPGTIAKLVAEVTALSGLEVDDEEAGTVSFNGGSRTA
jgi:hypothetical protein